MNRQHKCIKARLLLATTISFIMAFNRNSSDGRSPWRNYNIIEDPLSPWNQDPPTPWYNPTSPLQQMYPFTPWYNPTSPLRQTYPLRNTLLVLYNYCNGEYKIIVRNNNGFLKLNGNEQYSVCYENSIMADAAAVLENIKKTMIRHNISFTAINNEITTKSIHVVEIIERIVKELRQYQFFY